MANPPSSWTIPHPTFSWILPNTPFPPQKPETLHSSETAAALTPCLPGKYVNVGEIPAFSHSFFMLCKLFNNFFEIEFGTQSSSIFYIYIYSILKDAGCTEFVIRLLICLAQCAMHICTLSNSAVLIRNSLEVKSCYNWQNTKPQNEFTNWKQSKNSNGESNDDDDSAATKKHSAVTAVIW